MIIVGKYGCEARWVPDFWTIDGNRQYITFTKNVRKDGTTYGFIFFNLSIIFAIINEQQTTKTGRTSWVLW